MHRLRRSTSNYREIGNDSEGSEAQPSGKNLKLRQTPSLDTLVIPGRTRYPSGPPQKCRETSVLDLSVAKALLEANSSKSTDHDSQPDTSEPNHSSHSFQPRRPSLSVPDPQRRQFYRRLASGQQSELSNASTSLFSSAETTNSDAEEYAQQYNNLAAKFTLTGSAHDIERGCGLRHSNT